MLISALQHKSNSISNFLEKKSNFWFPWCSTREDLSVDVSITYVGLVFLGVRTEFNFVDFQLFEKNSHFWVSMKKYSWRPFHWCINYYCRTDIDEAKVISAIRQKSKFKLFWKKRILGIPWCSIREDLSIDVSITNVGLTLTKLRWFQLFVKNQNSNFELFWKKKSNFWVPMV